LELLKNSHKYKRNQHTPIIHPQSITILKEFIFNIKIYEFMYVSMNLTSLTTTGQARVVLRAISITKRKNNTSITQTHYYDSSIFLGSFLR